jgi:hypothetical protein
MAQQHYGDHQLAIMVDYCSLLQLIIVNAMLSAATRLVNPNGMLRSDVRHGGDGQGSPLRPRTPSCCVAHRVNSRSRASC